MRILLIPLLFRLLLAVLNRTFFQPDEFYQCLEPAHRIVFGYGHLTWEWRSERPIRSVFFPAIWVLVYWFLQLTGLHNGNWLVRNTDRIITPFD